MRAILSAILSLICFRFRSRTTLEFELISLRHQVAAARRRRGVANFNDGDRLFWILLYRIWPHGAKKFIKLLSPSSLIRWHSIGFKHYWRWKTGGWRNQGYRGGYHVMTDEIREIIRRMTLENPLWGFGRIHGELAKLGIKLSKSTVRLHMPKFMNRPDPGWRAFLRNHMSHTVAADFFSVVSAGFGMLYVLVLLDHRRREIIHFSVTKRRTQRWLCEEIEKAFKGRVKPKFLLRDGDFLYGKRFAKTLRKLRIKQRVTYPRSPWQNIYVERVIGSIRRECLDHIIAINRAHLHHIMSAYVEYYNKSRTHESLDEDCPSPRRIQNDREGKIISLPEVGGLHHRYERRLLKKAA